MSVKIVYNPGSGNVTLTFQRGPVGFKPYWAGRVHDNLATSGAVRERVVENLDILIAWQMPHMIVNNDIEQWAAFMSFALPGGQFQFFPSSTLPDNYDCVLEDTNWEPAVNAPMKYGVKVVIRILNDANAPSDPSVVLRRFYGFAD